MEEISLPPRQKSASAPQLPMSTLATTRAARKTTAHLPPTLEEISLPPRQYPPASAPGLPNPWLPTSTLATTRAARTAAAQAKAREEHRLATTKDQVNKILDASKFPFFSTAQQDQLLDDLLAAAASREQAITGASHDDGAQAWEHW